MTTNLVTELLVDGVYTAYPVYESEGVEISIGPDIDLELKPNTLDLAWKNPTLDLDPSNPASTLYGKIGRNTSTRVRLGPTPLTVFAGEASSWEPDETPNATSTSGRRWVKMSAAGISRRLGKWEDPLDSPLLRQNSSINGLLGYWPGEGGGSDTTLLSEVSGAPGAAAGSVSGTIDFGGDPGPGGGDTAMKIGTGGALAARFARVTSSGWQAVFHMKFPVLPSSGTFLDVFGVNLSNGNRVTWQAYNGGFCFNVFDPAGASKMSFTAGTGAIDITQWTRYRIKSTVSAGTVTMEFAWYSQDAPVVWGTTGTYADTGTGALLNWQISDNAWTDGAAYGHILATSDTSLNLTGDVSYIQAFNGYLGESAAGRVVRVGLEQGLSVTVIGTASDSVAMGRQKPDTISNIFEQCRESEGGLLFDHPQTGLVVFRTRRSLLNQTAALALSKIVNVSPPLTPVIGDNLIVNDVTVKNVDGTSVRVVVNAGTMSVLPPPAGAGRYRKTLDVNLANPLLLTDRGNWETVVGTTDRRWYKQITVDLLANPSLINTMIGLRPGDLITLAAAEPDTVPLMVCNVLWKIAAFPITAVLTCLPADAYRVGVYDATTSRRDATFSTTAGTSTTVAATVAVTNPVLTDCWSTTAVPYDVKITGERMTVTAATAPAGTGPYTQTLTVTRSVNGVVKTHAANESVNLADQVRYA